MISKPSLITRITVAKTVGFIIGAIGFFVTPLFGVDDLKIRLGVLFWYVTVGAFIGLAGVITMHPVLKIKLPWWLLGGGIGAWMNLLIILFAWDTLAVIMQEQSFMGLTSPWWGVLEGAVIGAILGGLATLFGGEGPETVR